MSDDDAIAAAAFRLVKSLVGALQEQFQLIGGFLEDGHADGDSHQAGEFVGVLGVQILKALTDFFRAEGSILQGAIGQEDDELFATVTAGEVFGADHTTKSFRHQAQGLVASGMAEGVVVTLEVIDIDHEEGEGSAVAAGAMALPLERFLEVAAIVETGERVAGRLDAKGLAEVEVGNSKRDLFSDRVGHLGMAAEFGGLGGQEGIGRQRVFLDNEKPNGLRIGGEGYRNGGTFRLRRARRSWCFTGQIVDARCGSVMSGERMRWWMRTPFSDALGACSGGVENRERA